MSNHRTHNLRSWLLLLIPNEPISIYTILSKYDGANRDWIGFEEFCDVTGWLREADLIIFESNLFSKTEKASILIETYDLGQKPIFDAKDTLKLILKNLELNDYKPLQISNEQFHIADKKVKGSSWLVQSWRLS